MLVVFVFIVLIVFVGAIIAFASSSQKEKERMEAIKQTISSTPDFSVTRRVDGLQGRYSFLVDETRRKIMIVRGTTRVIIPFQNIISVQLIENNDIIEQKSLGSTIGRTVVGGFLAGGAGAIVGGLSATAKQKKAVSSVKVKILLRNSTEPSITIGCFNASTMTAEGKPISPDDDLYGLGFQHANTITDCISVIIDSEQHQADNLDQAHLQVYSLADELLKLADLKNNGLLTEQEFLDQKAKLLSSGSSIPQSRKQDTIAFIDVDPIREKIEEMVRNEKAMDAISYYRDTMGCSFSEAMDYVTPIVEVIRQQSVELTESVPIRKEEQVENAQRGSYAALIWISVFGVLAIIFAVISVVVK